MPSHLGLIGLGLVGSALVDRFRDAGLALVGFDIDPAKCASAAARGVAPAGSPAAVAKQARRVVLSLPDSAVVDRVVEGPDGLSAFLRPGDLIIDTTTADPERSAALAGRLRARSVGFIDATILGSSRTVAAGEALVLAGGEASDVARARDVLDAFARRVFHMGPAGKGAEAKLVVNLVLGLNRLVLAEGLLLGAEAGMDLRVLLDALKEGAAYSRVMDAKGQKMIDGDFAPEARLGQHLKDVGLILDFGMRLGLKLPLSALHADVLRDGVAAGLGDRDNAAVIRALERYAHR